MNPTLESVSAAYEPVSDLKRSASNGNIMKTRYAHLLLVVCLSAPLRSDAELLMTLYGQPGESIVAFELSGSTQQSTSWSAYGGIYASLPSFDAISTSASGQFDIVSGSGAVSNLSTASSVPIDGLSFADTTLTRPNDGDVFGVSSPAYAATVGDIISWSGMGTIDLAQQGATFDDLAIGSGNGPVGLPRSGTARLTIAFVPEPTTVSLLGIGVLALVIARRKCYTRQQQC